MTSPPWWREKAMVCYLVDCSSLFCFLLIEINCTFSISYKILLLCLLLLYEFWLVSDRPSGLFSFVPTLLISILSSYLLLLLLCLLSFLLFPCINVRVALFYPSFYMFIAILPHPSIHTYIHTHIRSHYTLTISGLLILFPVNIPVGNLFTAMRHWASGRMVTSKNLMMLWRGHQDFFLCLLCYLPYTLLSSNLHILFFNLF